MPSSSSRTFLVPIGLDRRIIITLHAEDDASLPAPLEPSQWEPSPEPPSRIECIAAFTALHHARDITAREIVWKSPSTREPIPTQP